MSSSAALDCEGHAAGSDGDVSAPAAEGALHQMALGLANGGGTYDDGPPLLPAARWSWRTP